MNVNGAICVAQLAGMHSLKLRVSPERHGHKVRRHSRAPTASREPARSVSMVPDSDRMTSWHRVRSCGVGTRGLALALGLGLGLGLVTNPQDWDCSPVKDQCENRAGPGIGPQITNCVGHLDVQGMTQVRQ